MFFIEFRIRNIEAKVQLSVHILEFTVCFLAERAGLGINPIIPDTVLENEYDVLDELFNFEVLMLLKILFDCSKVHGLLNYLEVVGDVKFLGLYRFTEDPGRLQFRQVLDHS